MTPPQSRCSSSLRSLALKTTLLLALLVTLYHVCVESLSSPFVTMRLDEDAVAASNFWDFIPWSNPFENMTWIGGNVVDPGHRHPVGEDDREDDLIPEGGAPHGPENLLDVVLPRTHTRTPYNEFDPKKKYFLYSPSGGFNNQRECLLSAIEMARILKRTLYVPQAAKHTSMFQYYESLKTNEGLIPMDRILDFPYLESYKNVSLVPLDVSLLEFFYRVGKRYGRGMTKVISTTGKGVSTIYGDVRSWRKDEVLKILKPHKEPILFLRGEGFFHQWFATPTMTQIRKHARMAPSLRRLALEIVNGTIGTTPYYAMHIRLGDYTSRWDGGTGELFVRRALASKWKPPATLYVATDATRNHPFMRPILRTYHPPRSRVIFAGDIPGYLTRKFRNAFRDKSFRKDMFGVVEQLIATNAEDFIGSDFSTFTAFIKFSRSHKRSVFPESLGETPEEVEYNNQTSEGEGDDDD